MDQPQPQNPATTVTPEQPEQNSSKIKIKKKFAPKKLLGFILVLLLMAGSAYGGYYYRDRDADKDSQKHSAEMATLEKKVELLKTASDTDKSGGDDTPVSSDEDTPTSPTAEQLSNIEESITSGNTAALEERMASTVTVILAASEGIGERTVSEAIADLDYVVDLTASWNFNLSATKLEEFASGDYAQYFPEGALVGKSTTDKVVSFIFDDNAKIKTIFMSASSDIL